jgi:hypothetical protein
MCRARSLPVSGKKSALIGRLQNEGTSGGDGDGEEPQEVGGGCS